MSNQDFHISKSAISKCGHSGQNMMNNVTLKQRLATKNIIVI